jgi:hypothetical protein
MKYYQRYLSLLTITLFFATGTSCTQSDSSNSRQVPKGRLVTKAELGDKWPFTVDSGYVECPDSVSAIFRTADAVYGLNGMATSRGYAEPDPIRLADPTIPGAMISIGPLIDLARQECK